MSYELSFNFDFEDTFLDAPFQSVSASDQLDEFLMEDMKFDDSAEIEEGAVYHSVSTRNFFSISAADAERFVWYAQQKTRDNLLVIYNNAANVEDLQHALQTGYQWFCSVYKESLQLQPSRRKCFRPFESCNGEILHAIDMWKLRLSPNILEIFRRELGITDILSTCGDIFAGRNGVTFIDDLELQILEGCPHRKGFLAITTCEFRALRKPHSTMIFNNKGSTNTKLEDHVSIILRPGDLIVFENLLPIGIRCFGSHFTLGLFVSYISNNRLCAAELRNTINTRGLMRSYDKRRNKLSWQLDTLPREKIATVEYLSHLSNSRVAGCL